MSKKSEKSSNIKLAGLFILLVFGLISFSIILKIVFVINNSKFDANHKFNVLIIGQNESDVVSLSSQPKSISILNIPNSKYTLSSILKVPIDGIIKINGDINTKDISLIFIKSELPFGYKVSKLTAIDLLRLSLFTRTVSQSNVNERYLNQNLTDSQKETLISLTFNDPTIYQESKSIEIVNATGVNGLGGKLANFITNIGGNVILVSSSDKILEKSKIVYFGGESYTVEKLSSFFNLPKEKTDKQGIADIVITIGKDLGNSSDF